MTRFPAQGGEESPRPAPRAGSQEDRPAGELAPVERDALGRVLPGAGSALNAARIGIGALGGRPKGLARLIRERTRDGETIFAFLEDVRCGRALLDRTGRRRGRTPTISERLEAAKLELAYGWGRPTVLDADAVGGPEILILQLKPGQDF